MTWKSMEHINHLKKVRALLAPYQELWNSEVLNLYPHSLTHYQQDWLNSLKPLTQKERWLFDSKKDYQAITGSKLLQLINDINSLTKLERSDITPSDTLPDWAFVKVGIKKKHEILSLLPVIKDIPKIIDIGGGVGHLSRIIAHYYKKDTLCLEQDSNLIEIGKKRVAKYPTPEGAHQINFHQATFGEDDTDHIFSDETFSIGLHTCGPLAVEHMRSAIKNDESGMLNFGCCYPRICKESDQNISTVASTNPLLINEFGLTLATRSHAEISFEEYQLKEKVKNFRYHLHLFLYFKKDIKSFITLGNTPLRYYKNSFSEYALFNLERANISASIEELDLFHSDHKMNELVERLYLANLIRWQFGRLLEHYILTDRAIFLEESGYTVSMMEYFDESISPRNIGISAKKACRNT